MSPDIDFEVSVEDFVQASAWLKEHSGENKWSRKHAENTTGVSFFLIENEVYAKKKGYRVGKEAQALFL